MNCQSFEAAISDLARDQMMEASARNRALAHAIGCQRCAARLADERALTAGLQKIADEHEQAPAYVGASLLEAFRATVAAPTEPAVGISSRSHQWWRWAAAAALIVFVAVLAMIAARSRGGERQEPQKEAVKQENEQPAGARVVEKKPEEAVGHIAGSKGPAPDRSTHHGERRSVRRSLSNRDPIPVEAADGRTEVATEFIPLVHSDEMTPLDGGQIMRVELPRSALISFGLPMNIERAGERVKADVVVGNDGLARAIRFVH
ncbi:MAG TPA: hypothetical protein VNS63_22440 [Blastocatellia bacterium]|nr:hypothetical protein [Blastocatellia bacterium]